MTTQPADDAPKQDWRDWAKSVRSELNWAELSESTCTGIAGFPPFRHAESPLVYLPMQHEIDLQRLIAATPEKRWVITRTPDRGPLTLHLYGSEMETHRFGYQQPIAEAAEIDPSTVDFAFVPGLVFDLFGNRLGWGAGYYDRLLTTLKPGAVLVGVVPAALVVDQLPSEVHDVRVQWLAAEEGVVGVAL